MRIMDAMRRWWWRLIPHNCPSKSTGGGIAYPSTGTSSDPGTWIINPDLLPPVRLFWRCGRCGRPMGWDDKEVKP